MKVSHVLLISLLIVGTLFVPAVSAEYYTFDLTEESSYHSSGQTNGSFYHVGNRDLKYLSIINSEHLYGKTISHIFCQIPAGSLENSDDLGSSVSTRVTIGDWGRATYGYFKYESYGNPWIQVYLTDFEYLSDYPIGLSGKERFLLTPDDDDFVFPKALRGFTDYDKDYDLGLAICLPTSDLYPPGTHYYLFTEKWENTLTIDTQPDRDKITLTRYDIVSQIDIITSTDEYEEISNDDFEVLLSPLLHRPYSVIVTNPISGNTYSYNINRAGILQDGQTDPDDPVLRTGTVTMTDHNGTSIHGFEVTAVNHYTGESHTVQTDTDVAVITLPMDRTTEIRNPQTGVYEEAPVGYYTFYGQKPGYKILHEDGIRVRVMPEKYGSYKLCDILVSSDSGPLTGKHQFQLRSRSDFSILQTGTISAKSRTTGIWYNTTVVDGLATLILPYDTSDAISEYAGHYYVYATSPGYEDSDYGTQIAVYPHTVSEIKSILLTPIGGVPTPGNVTLRIQAISETGQSVPNAEIFIAGVIGAGKDVWDTYTTSWTGFLEVSVPGNSTYDIVARGAGYYDSSRRIEVFTEDPPIIEMYLYLSGAPTVEPTTEPTGWPTVTPTTQPTGGIPDEDDDSDGFMMESVRGIANLFGVSFGTGKTILGMLLALGIGTATAKHLKGGAQEFGMGMLGGVVLGVLIGLLPIWVLVLLVLIVGLWIGQRYMSGGES